MCLGRQILRLNKLPAPFPLKFNRDLGAVETKSMMKKNNNENNYCQMLIITENKFIECRQNVTSVGITNLPAILMKKKKKNRPWGSIPHNFPPNPVRTLMLEYYRFIMAVFQFNHNGCCTLNLESDL